MGFMGSDGAKCQSAGALLRFVVWYLPARHVINCINLQQPVDQKLKISTGRKNGSRIPGFHHPKCRPSSGELKESAIQRNAKLCNSFLQARRNRPSH